MLNAMSSHVCPCLLRYFFHNFFHDKNTFFVIFLGTYRAFSSHSTQSVLGDETTTTFSGLSFSSLLYLAFLFPQRGLSGCNNRWNATTILFHKIDVFSKKISSPVKTFYFSFQTDVYTKFQRKQKINWETSSNHPQSECTIIHC